MIQLIKERVEGGVYSVDSDRVAEAILARRGDCRTLRSLWSQMLVAPLLAGGNPLEGKSFPSRDAS